MKILILIISSKGFPYDDYKELWREYMHLDEDIDSYFIEMGEETVIKDDVITINGEETYDKIFYKTQEALKMFDLSKYDYIFRTNLSSFIVFNKYKIWLQTLPKTRVYNGPIHWHTRYIYASGCGFTITPDVAKLIIDYDENSQTEKHIDDVTIGRICMINSIQVTSAPLNCIFTNTFYHETELFDEYECAFHFRTKTGGSRNDDITVYKDLLDMYYPKDVINFEKIKVENGVVILQQNA